MEPPRPSTVVRLPVYFRVSLDLCCGSTRLVTVCLGSVDLASFLSSSLKHLCLGLIAVLYVLLWTWKAVNNLGVALLSQGKLKEVRLYSFWGRPRPWCLLYPGSTTAIGYSGHRDT